MGVYSEYIKICVHIDIWKWNKICFSLLDALIHSVAYSALLFFFSQLQSGKESSIGSSFLFFPRKDPSGVNVKAPILFVNLLFFF